MWGALSALGKLFGFLEGLLDWRKRKAHENTGRLKERVDQYERASDAKKLMDSVERPARDDIVDRLRKHDF